MKRCLTTLALVSFLQPTAAAAKEKDNPFRKAKVGDYVAYKMTTKVMDKLIETTMRQTVAAKNAKELTLKTTAKFMGTDVPAQNTKIDLTKPYDPTTVVTRGNKNAKFEKIEDGTEKVKIGDTTYACNWIKGKVTAEAGGQKLETEVKLWFSKDVPLTGVVKMEMKSKFAGVSMEMTEAGNEK